MMEPVMPSHRTFQEEDKRVSGTRGPFLVFATAKLRKTSLFLLLKAVCFTATDCRDILTRNRLIHSSATANFTPIFRNFSKGDDFGVADILSAIGHMFSIDMAFCRALQAVLQAIPTLVSGSDVIKSSLMCRLPIRQSADKFQKKSNYLLQQCFFAKNSVSVFPSFSVLIAVTSAPTFT